MRAKTRCSKKASTYCCPRFKHHSNGVILSKCARGKTFIQIKNCLACGQVDVAPKTLTGAEWLRVSHPYGLCEFL